MILRGEIYENLMASLYRIGMGYVIGAVVGIVAGVILGFSKWADALGTPIVYAIYSSPKIALLPLFILWLGIGELSKVTIIALGVFFPVVLNMFAGVYSVA